MKFKDDPDILKKMTNMGMFAYSADQVINILDIDDGPEFKAAFDNKDSDIRKAYAQGKDKLLLTMDQSLMAAAKKGNLDAKRELESRIKKRETGR